MKPTFKTDRLDVFHMHCERGQDSVENDFWDVDVYSVISESQRRFIRTTT